MTVKKHEVVHTFTEIEEYPEHEDRAESHDFKANRHQLINVDGHTCFVCKLLDMKPPDEPLEAHHFLAEWSEWNNVDPVKLQGLFDVGIFDFYGYSAKLKGHPVLSPDDIRNLLILCSKHHRAKGVGIHNTTGPLWFSQAVARDGVDVLRGAAEEGA